MYFEPRRQFPCVGGARAYRALPNQPIFRIVCSKLNKLSELLSGPSTFCSFSEDQIAFDLPNRGKVARFVGLCGPGLLQFTLLCTCRHSSPSFTVGVLCVKIIYSNFVRESEQITKQQIKLLTTPVWSVIVFNLEFLGAKLAERLEALFTRILIGSRTSLVFS